MTEYSGGPCCACIRVEYDPEDVEFENPVTGKMINGKRERWLCKDCGSEFSRTNWHAAVVKQQQDEIERLREVVSEFEALIDDSHGVVGLHLNGDTAHWDWLMDNEWLENYQALQKGDTTDG